MSVPNIHADDRLWLLTERYVAAELSAAEANELERLLDADAEAMRFFVAYLDMEAEIAWPRRAVAAPAASSASSHAKSTRNPFMLAVAAAASVAIVGVVGWAYLNATTSPDAVAPAPRPVAVITQTDGVEWLSEPRAPGDDLPPQMLSIASGLIEIDFRGGASVMVVGPATLDLHSGDRVTLDRGELFARVPSHAIGFTVNGPGGLRVTDLGTEFAMRVGESGVSRVHVLDGAVVLAIGGRVEAMVAGDAYIVSQTGELTDASFRRDGLRVALAPHDPLDAPAIVGQPSVFQQLPERYAAAHLLDEQHEGEGADWAGQGPGPHAVALDFGGSVWLRGLRWAHRVDSGNPPIDIARRLELTFSDDDVFNDHDATLSVEPGAAFGVQTILFPAHRARFVRITIVGIEHGAGNPGGSLLKFFGERIESNASVKPVAPPPAHPAGLIDTTRAPDLGESR